MTTSVGSGPSSQFLGQQRMRYDTVQFHHAPLMQPTYERPGTQILGHSKTYPTLPGSQPISMYDQGHGLPRQFYTGTWAQPYYNQPPRGR